MPCKAYGFKWCKANGVSYGMAQNPQLPRHFQEGSYEGNFATVAGLKDEGTTG